MAGAEFPRRFRSVSEQTSLKRRRAVFCFYAGLRMVDIVKFSSE
jgi:hypothetical protein